ncbi:MAG: terminase large subunit, partial [Erysipelotrichaceae bacterium]
NGTKVLPQFETLEHSKVMAAIDDIKKPMLLNGMDFGFVTSYNAFIRLAIDHDNKIMYIYGEYYKKNMTDDKTAKELEEYKDIKIVGDSAEQKTIQYFRQQGFNMVPATKFPGSRLQNTKKVKRFKKIICSTKCVNTIDELSDLTYKIDKNGDMIEDEFNIDPHTLVA